MILFYILIRIWMPVRWCFRTIWSSKECKEI
jgi:hypothetical protein